MFYLVATIHVIVSVFLIIVVLLQSGKAADLAGAFGGLGSQTVFGPRGSATVLTRATTISAIVFMLTSLTLSLVSGPAGGGSGSDILNRMSTGSSSAPAAPKSQTPLPAPTPATVPGTPAATPVPVAPVPAPAEAKQK